MRKTLLLVAIGLLIVLVVLLLTGRGQERPPSPDGARRPAVRGLGYLAGYERASGPTGVTVHEEAASPGLNVVTSAHAPEALLIDMEGEVLHRWSVPFRRAFPDTKTRLWNMKPRQHRMFRRSHARPNGDLYAIFAAHGLVKLDWDSEVLWSRFNYAHHDLEVDAAGRVHVLAKKPRRIRAGDGPFWALDEVIKTYGPDGRLLGEISLYDAFRRSSHARIMEYLARERDPLHANSLRLLGDTPRPEAWRSGDFLVSIREIDTVAVIDRETRRVVWSMVGRSTAQHDARHLPPSDLLLFDNIRSEGESAVVQMDVATRDVVWEYRDPAFSSRIGGMAQRLPGGHTLITDTTSGRAFEVTREGRIVWEWINPHTARRGRVATLFGVERLPTDYFEARPRAPGKTRP